MKLTSKNLFEFIYTQMIKLDKKKITTDEARSQAGLARQANNALRYKIDKAHALVKLKNAKISGEIIFDD